MADLCGAAILWSRNGGELINVVKRTCTSDRSGYMGKPRYACKMGFETCESVLIWCERPRIFFKKKPVFERSGPMETDSKPLVLLSAMDVEL